MGSGHKSGSKKGGKKGSDKGDSSKGDKKKPRPVTPPLQTRRTLMWQCHHCPDQGFNNPSDVPACLRCSHQPCDKCPREAQDVETPVKKE